MPTHHRGRLWYDMLGVSPDAIDSVIQAAFRRKAHEAHPDRGGDLEAMRALIAARDEGMA